MQKRVSLAVGEGLGPSRQSSETLERKSWANSQIATNSPDFFLAFCFISPGDREGRPYR